MNTKQKTFSAVMSGMYGNQARTTVILSASSQVAFATKQAIFASLKREVAGNVAHDDATLAAMALLDATTNGEGCANDHGHPVVKPVNPLQGIEAMAAVFIALKGQSWRPNPDNGKSQENLVKYLRSPLSILEESIAFATGDGFKDDEARIRSDAVMLKKDATAVDASIAMLKDQKRALFAEHYKPYIKHFADCIKAHATDDDATLCGIVEEFLCDAGKDAWKLAVDAAKWSMDKQRERDRKGLYTRPDPGVFALSEA